MFLRGRSFVWPAPLSYVSSFTVISSNFMLSALKFYSYLKPVPCTPELEFTHVYKTADLTSLPKNLIEGQTQYINDFP